MANPAAGRRELARVLGDLGWSDAGRADAAMLAAELLGNAVRHGAHPVSLRVEASPHRCTLQISDSGPGHPVRSGGSGIEPGGRGLHIVDRLADWWGVTELVGGKVVWAYIQDRHGTAEEADQRPDRNPP